MGEDLEGARMVRLTGVQGWGEKGLRVSKWKGWERRGWLVELVQGRVVLEAEGGWCHTQFLVSEPGWPGGMMYIGMAPTRHLYLPSDGQTLADCLGSSRAHSLWEALIWRNCWVSLETHWVGGDIEGTVETTATGWCEGAREEEERMLGAEKEEAWKGVLAKVGGELRYCDIMGTRGKGEGRGVLSVRCHREGKRRWASQEEVWEFLH